MKKRTFLVLLASALALVPTSGSASSAAIVIIVNKANPATKLGRSDLRPIFQTTKTEWSDGSKILALNLPESNSLRQGVDAAVMGLDPDRVAQFWIDRKIRGGAVPPKKIPSSSMMLKIVSKKAEAIGYVAEGEVDDSVKVVAKIVNGEVK